MRLEPFGKMRDQPRLHPDPRYRLALQTQKCPPKRASLSGVAALGLPYLPCAFSPGYDRQGRDLCLEGHDRVSQSRLRHPSNRRSAFLANPAVTEHLQVSGDGVIKFSRLIGAGLAAFDLSFGLQFERRY
jgi:hypothetical protein